MNRDDYFSKLSKSKNALSHGMMTAEPVERVYVPVVKNESSDVEIKKMISNYEKDIAARKSKLKELRDKQEELRANMESTQNLLTRMDDEMSELSNQVGIVKDKILEDNAKIDTLQSSLRILGK